MKRHCMIFALGFGPLLIVFGVIRLTHNPIADAFMALAGCCALSWALLSIFDAVSRIFTVLDEATQAVKEAEDHLVDRASAHLTMAVLDKISELYESIEEEEG
jgi:hypothetical protein